MGKKIELEKYRWIHEPYIAYIDHEAKEVLYLNRKYKFLGLDTNKFIDYPIKHSTEYVYLYQGRPPMKKKDRETYLGKVNDLEDRLVGYRVLEGMVAVN